MALLRINPLLHLLLIAVSAVSMAATGDTDKMHALIYRGCSDEEYDRGSAYESNLHGFLDSVGRATSYFHREKVGELYGVFQCRGDVTEEECGGCKRVVAMRAAELCAGSVGARVQLNACSLRYGNSKFFGGAPDEEVVYKACSPQTATDPAFFTRRDNVLTGLEQGSFSGNNFRVTSSGDSKDGLPVYGYAQCEGDLSWPECGFCVHNAASDVKTICPNSVAAEVYLHKCSVRYAQDVDSHPHPDPAPDTKPNHVTAKTVAIVIGGVAAIVFTFIFLLFLKSVCKNAD